MLDDGLIEVGFAYHDGDVTALKVSGILLQELAHQFQRCVLVSLGLDQHIEHFAFGVDRAPAIDHLAVDFQIDLVEMPG